MSLRRIYLLSLVFCCFLWLPFTAVSQNTVDESEIKVALRKIGHDVLLSSGDSTSRVLPIVKEENRYRIPLDAEFEFRPEYLVTTVDRVVRQTGLASSYIFEVEDCTTGEMVYSFKMEDALRSDIIHCGSRMQPKGCYNLLFTILENEEKETAALAGSPRVTNESNGNTLLLIYLFVFVLLSATLWLIFYRSKRRKMSKIKANLIPLGQYRFDKRNTELLIEKQRIELTAKEGDLLLLLYDAANTTVEREVILNRVWGDEGDYVGRTLDVFISKLRKKLEFDAKVKIVNIRGVGYKLVLDE